MTTKQAMNELDNSIMNEMFNFELLLSKQINQYTQRCTKLITMSNQVCVRCFFIDKYVTHVP